MSSKIFWLFLVMLLSVSSFGVWLCFTALFAVLSSLFGIGCSMYFSHSFMYKYTEKDRSLLSKSKVAHSLLGVFKIVLQMNGPSKISKFDQRLTGSSEIDVPMREILFYIMRDFINSWYKEVSSDKEFVNKLNEMLKHFINNFSVCSKRVNWISFITQKVVEDFTTHLRLYRFAEVRFAKQKKESLDNCPDIASVFFDLESELNDNACHRNICTSSQHQNEYMQCICNILLYLLLLPEDFNNKMLNHFLRELLACSLLEPLVSQLSDPDVINQNLIWLCKDHPVCSKSLLSVLRRTDSKEELLAFQQISKHEIKVQKAKDAGDKDERKKYVKSISFVQDISQQRFERLCGYKNKNPASSEFYLSFDTTDMLSSSSHCAKEKRLVSLPFDIILNNNIALHYFTQYLANIDAENYLFFYHSVEGFRTTVEMIEVDCNTEKRETVSEKLRNFALQIFHSYFSLNATSKIDVDENLVKELHSKIKNGNIKKHCFDDVQDKVRCLLENEFYLNGFKDTKQYVKLLAELDLINDLSSDIDSLSSSKSEEEEILNCDTIDSTDDEVLNHLLGSEISSNHIQFPEISSGPLHDKNKEIGLLFAEVHSTGITHHAGKTFAVYAIAVSHHPLDGPEEKWFIVRRYSEFYDFHELLIKKFPLLAHFNFPSKKPFNNLTRQLMEKRCHMLNDFMQFLLSPQVLSSCDDLNVMIYNFLQPNVCEKNKKSFVRTVRSFVDPLKTSVGNVGNVVKLLPDTLFELRGGLARALSRNEVSGGRPERLGEERSMSYNSVRAEDIPFQIILRLMDEVFSLRDKDLWFRRRIMALLRQIIQTMQGGAINRKIKDYVQSLTSPSQIAEWLRLLSKSVWPDGMLADASPERDDNTKLRTRIATKMLLFAAIPDELKRIIGYETSFKGAMLTFNVFQHPSLNRRLLFVLLESFLEALFPHCRTRDLVHRFHLDPQVRRQQRRKSVVLENGSVLPEAKKAPDPRQLLVDDLGRPATGEGRRAQPRRPVPKSPRTSKKRARRAVFYTEETGR